MRLRQHVMMEQFDTHNLRGIQGTEMITLLKNLYHDEVILEFYLYNLQNGTRYQATHIPEVQTIC